LRRQAEAVITTAEKIAHRFTVQIRFPMKTRLFSALAALTVLAVNPSPLLAAGDAKAELKTLVDEIQAKIKAGQGTETALAENLTAFDTLLAAHKGETTDDVAQILYMKATLYTQVIGDNEKGIAFLKQLKADFPRSAQAQRVDGLVASLETQRAFAAGKVFPDFAEQDLDGKPLSIANYKGKIVLLDFWATWCGPCVDELPNVVAAYKKYHGRGFEIIGISLDRADARQKLIDFTKSHQMPWVQFYDGKYWDNKLSKQYGIHSIPATFLLDGEGRVVARDLRGAALDKKLATLLPAK
jgi:peroxiredoxin